MKAVLFDLDGTLLENQFDSIMKEYCRRLASYFREWVSTESFIQQLLRSTYVMIGDTDGEKLNIEVFMNDFFPKLGLDREAMSIFDHFYAEEFPKLKDLAKAHPKARNMVQLAFEQGYKVVIATNPVFPGKAIYERLRWADVADLDYCLVTAVDNMHFCKPHVQYYLEIAARIGVDPRDCLMVGDDSENDGAAAKAGMELFLLTDGRTLGDVQDILLRQRS